MTNSPEFICTDQDTNQHGRYLGDRVYEFFQDVNTKHGKHREYGEIDLNSYTEAEIEDHLSPYGYSIEQLFEENDSEDAEWLIAECIFEQELF